MTLISPSELLAIQSIAESGMTGTATILTRATVETANGQESVWATVGEDVPCWVKQVTGDSALLGAISGGVGIGQVFNVRVPIGSAVNSGDELAIGSIIYSVESQNQSDTYPAWLECNVRTVE